MEIMKTPALRREHRWNLTARGADRVPEASAARQFVREVSRLPRVALRETAAGS